MLSNLQELLGALLMRMRAEEGQTFVEYALLVVFIALVAVLGATILGSSISSMFSSIAGHL
jgi:pilus assembly protein Flp/PilA